MTELEARILQAETRLRALEWRASRAGQTAVAQSQFVSIFAQSGFYGRPGPTPLVFSSSCNAFYPETLTLTAYGVSGSVTWDSGSSRYVGAITYSNRSGAAVYSNCGGCVTGGSSPIVFQINPANWQCTVQRLPCGGCIPAGLTATGMPGSLTGSNVFGGSTATTTANFATRSCSPLDVLWSVLISGWSLSQSVRLTI